MYGKFSIPCQLMQYESVHLYIINIHENCWCLVCSLQRSMWPKYILQISCYCFYALYAQDQFHPLSTRSLYYIMAKWWNKIKVPLNVLSYCFTITVVLLLYSIARNIPSFLCLISIVVVLYYQLKRTKLNSSSRKCALQDIFLWYSCAYAFCEKWKKRNKAYHCMYCMFTVLFFTHRELL